MNPSNQINYILGLDVGIASVGWAVLACDDNNNTNDIIDLGVRAFDKAEHPKDGKSLNFERRSARSMRRRIRRRSHRLLRLRRLLIRKGLLNPQDLDAEGYPKFAAKAWQFRAEGLTRCLSALEWAEVLYHIIKNRGYLSTRKSEFIDDAGSETIITKEQQEKSDENKKMLQAVQAMSARLQEGGWQTIGQMVYEDHSEFGLSIRNKQGDYRHSFNRLLLKDEIHTLFDRQRDLGNPHTSADFENEVAHLLMQQRPALSGKNLLKMVGNCSFEANQKRAPRQCWSSERFNWLSKLNHIRIIEGSGNRRGLTQAERLTLRDQPYLLSQLKYSQARKLLALPNDSHFVGLRYSAEKDPEKAVLFEMKAWHKLRQAMTKANLESEWRGMSTRGELLDKICTVLTIYKDDQEIRDELSKLELPPSCVEALLNVSFDKFHHLSLRALQRIIPHLEQGLRYDEACTAAGYHHSQTKATDKQALLPPIPTDEIRNPVVLRALTQARKVVNAIVREYGNPSAVRIELARDLSKPFDDRKKIQTEQKKWQDVKEDFRKHFIEHFGHEPNGKQLLKYRLYREQIGKCAYSLKCIDLNRLPEERYCEIDHILPYSRTYDDSMANKVLVLSEENQNKGNRTPWEFFGAANPERWESFSAWVKATRGIRQAKRNRLLKLHLDQADSAEFKERNLSDTRYIARFLKNFIENYLIIRNSDTYRVEVTSGSLTAFLRSRWGLIKNREESDLHHAMDAAVVAVSTRSFVKRLSDYSRRKELERIRDRYTDPETNEIVNPRVLECLELHFPLPWQTFREDLLARLTADPQQALLNLPHWHGRDLSHVRPIIVSRAPKRSVQGRGHQDTIRSSRLLDESISIVRVPLKSLTLEVLERMHAKERNWSLYEALKSRLEEHSNKPEKAFAQAFFRPSKNGSNAPLVRRVKVETKQVSGIKVRNGIADADSMLCADIYRKSGKYFIVPVYAYQIASNARPNRAIIAHKPENEWNLMDESYEFVCTLFRNDLISLTTNKGHFFGYYSGLDRSTGGIDITTHDRNSSQGKLGTYRSIGLKTAKNFEKYNIDVLGRYHLVEREKIPWVGER